MDDIMGGIILGGFVGAVVLLGVVYLGVRMGVKHGALDADRERARVASKQPQPQGE